MNFAVMFSAVRVYTVNGEEDVDVCARPQVKHDRKATAWRVKRNMVVMGE
jgi:hypothetical protein